MVHNDYFYGHFCWIRNQVRLPTLSLSCGSMDAACTSPRKLSLLPLIASTTTEACSLPESLSGQRKRMLGLSEDCAMLRHLSPVSLYPCVFPPLYWQRPLSAERQHCSLLRPSLCSLISHISCHRRVAFLPGYPHYRRVTRSPQHVAGAVPKKEHRARAPNHAFLTSPSFTSSPIVTLVTTHIYLWIILRLLF